MKYSLAFTSLVATTYLLMGCGSDSDPAPVASTTNPASPMNNPSTPGGVAGAGSTTPAPSGVSNPATPPTGTGTGSETPAVPTTLTPGMMGGNAGGAPGATTPPSGAAGAAPMNAAGAPAVPPGELTLEELVGDMDGHLFSVACGDQPNADDCNGEGWRSSRAYETLNICQNARLDARIDFPVAGTPGTGYDVKMHFYGVMEPRNYGTIVTRDAQGRPSLQAGGTPTPFASMVPGAGNYLATGDNNYNTYELHVLDNNQQEVAIHFLNADTQTGHYTMGINYEKTLRLIGGGTLRLQIADANCRQIKNCGPGGVPCAGKAQTIDISAANPQPPSAFAQPALGKLTEHSGQWFLLDVLSFAPAP